MRAQGVAAAIQVDRFLERGLAALEPADDLLERLERVLKGHAGDVGRGVHALASMGQAPPQGQALARG